MSYPARKVSRHPLWILVLASIFLIGCDDDSDSGLGGSSSDSDQETSQVDEGDSSSDNGQGTASDSDSQALLSWQAPVQRENGDSLRDGEIAHYLIIWGQDPENLDQTQEVSCGSCQDMEYTVEDLDEGDWYFSVQTVDTEGNVSRRADPVSKSISG